MSKYIDFKKDIAGYEDVFRTVKAMEKVAVSSLHTVQSKVSILQAYRLELEEILGAFKSFYAPSQELFKHKKNSKKTLVVITGNKGLVGDLYHLISSFAHTHKSEYNTFVSVGAKGREYLEGEEIEVSKEFVALDELFKSPSEDAVAFLWQLFIKDHHAIDILYPKYVTIAKQEAAVVPFLPLSDTDWQKNKYTGYLPLFGTAKSTLFDWLLKTYTHTYFYSFLLEAKLSELSARTVSMEHAQKKTEALVRHIKISYFKSRKMEETQKQLESFAAHAI